MVYHAKSIGRTLTVAFIDRSVFSELQKIKHRQHEHMWQFALVLRTMSWDCRVLRTLRRSHGTWTSFKQTMVL